MAMIVTDCPRCGANSITHDMLFDIQIGTNYYKGWGFHYECLAVCRNCSRPTIYNLLQKEYKSTEYLIQNDLSSLDKSINYLVEVTGYISIKDQHKFVAPDYVPDTIKVIFDEGATCLSVGCYNAAATMFRLCVDIIAREKTPDQESDGPKPPTGFMMLGKRLKWLFENNLLPRELEELSICIKEDGNDGAHAGTLTKIDAHDLLDFTTELLRRIYTEPERLRLAKTRRDERRLEEK